ncbi:hypothetical protein L227DRAFT_566015 [Lentinus tigrinus ALCF2SS1-6]|uniref:C2H2-type domain-containing protein n=1 Tax=Lentinus tigrinus ALCF2SS1-6 TaxID=1328759 RepID=A0A5C2RZ70_9APHY|nr:hypothetical protein L227DRAFT_566015 [Lentinus tigrinus ALCF2SS1-6]
MAIKVRCNQCRLVLSGKRQGNKHAEETGHVWKPGYQCTHCGAAYMKRRECRGHATCSSGPAPYPAPLLAKFATQPVAETSDARATSPYWSWATFQEQMQSSLHRDRSATSATYSPMAPHFLSSGVPISQLVKCSQCHEHFRDAIVLQNVGDKHLQIAHSGSHCGPRSQTCSTDGAAHEGCHPLAVGVLTIKEDEAAAPSALTSSEEPRIESAAMCKMCSALFPNKDTLDEHLASTFTCLKCAIHHASEEELQEHYQRESKLHPKCKDCGLALADSPTWAQMHPQRDGVKHVLSGVPENFLRQVVRRTLEKLAPRTFSFKDLEVKVKVR